MGRAAGFLVGLVLACLAIAPARAESPFDHWASVVIAGDWRAHGGGSTEAFDNARRDVAENLVGLGFPAPTQFSVRPKRYRNQALNVSNAKAIEDGLRSAAKTSTGGCLVYITSHGAPQGVIMGKKLLRPQELAAMVDGACPGRPSIVVISACFSGVFVPSLERDDRMILTAARPDRTSFGCGESDRYPYFDDCFLGEIGKARDFAVLGRAVQACVARKEIDTGASPPSEPQLWIGPELRPLLPLYTFAKARKPAPAPNAAPPSAEN
ncbi:peptidase C13 [Caulobacter sp. D4A]|uniref:C13 family peptidase n=1 Tax=unclassified Caulobacter TaxID=2648921 RepID=UPI000D72BE1E|nr:MULTISPECIES: C13 family peptidase [unclassified Caulobacter]PXA82379.1 peptidase C13 [Caulobacter sp. D4A]PXA95188.1 peptidase C13 [Caulobacter sp. D5]